MPHASSLACTEKAKKQGEFGHLNWFALAAHKLRVVVHIMDRTCKNWTMLCAVFHRVVHSTNPRIMSATIRARKSSTSSQEKVRPRSSGCTPRVSASAKAHIKTPHDEPSFCCGSAVCDPVPVPSGLRRHLLNPGAILCLSAHSSTKY